MQSFIMKSINSKLFFLIAIFLIISFGKNEVDILVKNEGVILVKNEGFWTKIFNFQQKIVSIIEVNYL